MKKRIAHMGAPGKRRTTSGYVMKTSPNKMNINYISKTPANAKTKCSTQTFIAMIINTWSRWDNRFNTRIGRWSNVSKNRKSNNTSDQTSYGIDDTSDNRVSAQSQNKKLSIDVILKVIWILTCNNCAWIYCMSPELAVHPWRVKYLNKKS